MFWLPFSFVAILWGAQQNILCWLSFYVPFWKSGILLCKLRPLNIIWPLCFKAARRGLYCFWGHEVKILIFIWVSSAQFLRTVYLIIIIDWLFCKDVNKSSRAGYYFYIILDMHKKHIVTMYHFLFHLSSVNNMAISLLVAQTMRIFA